MASRRIAIQSTGRIWPRQLHRNGACVLETRTSRRLLDTAGVRETLRGMARSGGGAWGWRSRRRGAVFAG
uniref:Uncharacterized protein n=1 Tax=Arundo donax TaxID=35708 RepID=A0A0A9BYB6_ARUDO